VAFVFALFAQPAQPATAQRGARTSVKAHLTSGVVKLGGEVTIVVSVANAREVRMTSVPEVEGLEIGSFRGGPTQTTTYINGRRTRTVEYNLTAPVRPTRLGEFRIPPIELTAENQSFSTPELALTVVEDLRGAELGLFEVRASSDRVVEGQPFSVELIVGFDAGIAQRINYVNLSLPWWDQLPGTVELDDKSEQPPGANSVEFDLNSQRKIRGERLPGRDVRGRPFIAFRLVRSFLPTRSGPLEFPTSFVEFGEVERVRDFFRPETRKVETWYARADAFDMEVVPLPEKGRPVDFSGAIGQIVAQADAEPRDVDAGDSIKFAVEWTGAGNLEFFAPPDPGRLEAFRGFRTYGMTEEAKTIDRRRVVYDLAPLTSEVGEIPPLPLIVFDPELDQYRTIETQPIAIRVRALENAAGLTAPDGAENFASDVRDIVAVPRERRDGRGPGGGFVGGLLLATPLAWLGLRTAVRRRGDPDAPLERRRRRARRALARALAAAPDAKAQLDAVQAFLGARTREPDAAWGGRDVRAYFAGDDAQLDTDRAEELATLLADLERAVYGGGAAVEHQRVSKVAGDLLRGGL
jgi:hypothetical protein